MKLCRWGTASVDVTLIDIRGIFPSWAVCVSVFWTIYILVPLFFRTLYTSPVSVEPPFEVDVALSCRKPTGRIWRICQNREGVYIFEEFRIFQVKDSWIKVPWVADVQIFVELVTRYGFVLFFFKACVVFFYSRASGKVSATSNFGKPCRGYWFSSWHT